MSKIWSFIFFIVHSLKQTFTEHVLSAGHHAVMSKMAEPVLMSQHHFLQPGLGSKRPHVPYSPSEKCLKTCVPDYFTVVYSRSQMASLGFCSGPCPLFCNSVSSRITLESSAMNYKLNTTFLPLRPTENHIPLVPKSGKLFF